jgi:D-alanyl-lipoteichoic acid acyltransferase DltB (MBOAT superfamily)
LLGIFKKVLIADRLARHINPLFENFKTISSLEAWLATLGYTFQLYFDFSGYSDMAIGIAFMIGFRLPINFNSPYKAINITDFWRRWHISLSKWLRDYLYIPLGGNKKSKKRTIFNIIIVFLLGGLWHGAKWTFFIWGLYQGGMFLLYNTIKDYWDKMNFMLQRFLTFFIVTIGWVFFRSDDMQMSGLLLKKMFLLDGFLKESMPIFILFKLSSWMILLYCFVNIVPNTNSLKPVYSIRYGLVFACLFMLTILEINSLKLDFLYYQF